MIRQTYMYVIAIWLFTTAVSDFPPTAPKKHLRVLVITLPVTTATGHTLLHSSAVRPQ